MIEPFVIHAIVTDTAGRIGLCRLPGRSGDLAGDLGVIAHWPARIVVSMTEHLENDTEGAAGLGAALALAGIRHLVYPIRDFGTPEPNNRDWPALADELHAALDAGANVLLHCLGGKGRSGMVALRLLVERGENPGAALARLRHIRPGAVETSAQEAWARQGNCSRHTAGH